MAFRVLAGSMAKNIVEITAEYDYTTNSSLDRQVSSSIPLEVKHASHILSHDVCK